MNPRSLWNAMLATAVVVSAATAAATAAVTYRADKNDYDDEPYNPFSATAATIIATKHFSVSSFQK